MSDSILILGAGRIGSSIAYLIQQTFAKSSPYVPKVVVADVSAETFNTPLLDHVEHVVYDGSEDSMLAIMKKVKPKLLVNALPYELNERAMRVAAATFTNYLDMSEDVKSRKLIGKLFADNNTVMPQQGLAPGLVNIMACWLLKQHADKEAKELRLRVGALPQVSRGRLGYATTWSVEGLVNEYLNDAEELVDGRVIKQPGMSGYERLSIRGVELEAFRTSGGVGELPRLLKKQVPNVNYKTLRWPGHYEVMRLLLDEFHLDRKLLKSLFKSAVPSRAVDCVYLLVSLDVIRKDGTIETYDFGRRYVGLNINGQRFDAIQAVTALGAVGIIELFYCGQLPTGLITHDMIDYGLFEMTESGKLLNMATDTYLNGVW